MTTQTSINQYGNFNIIVFIDGKPIKGYNNVKSLSRLQEIYSRIKSQMLCK